MFQRASPSRGRFTGCVTGMILGATLMASSANAGVVTLDTSSLAGNAARLEINLLDGDGVFGNSQLSALGDSISDPGQIIKDFLAGESFSFNLDFLFNAGADEGDVVVLNLLDPDTNFSLIDTDLDLLDGAVPYQDALLVCALGSGSCATARFSDPAIEVSFVPEPAGAAFLALGGILLLSGRRNLCANPVI